MTQVDQAELTPLNTRWAAQLFDVGRSIRYNNRRAAFWGSVDKISSALNIIFGSAVIMGLLQSSQTLAVVAASSVVVLSAVNLVWGSSRLEHLHQSLSARYRAIELDMRQATPSEDALKAAISARLMTENDEPPARMVLNLMCHNELVTALGYPSSNRVKLSFFQRFFAQVIDIKPRKIEYDA